MESSSYDPTYAKRHASRNDDKIQAIVSHMPNVESILDIGTNHGYVAKAILTESRASFAHGLELEEGVLDPELLSRPDFTLHVGDIADFTFEQIYDVIIYNAVHHHVIGKYGMATSWRVWKNIIDHCGHTLFFETGLSAESGEYYWKDALLKHYPNDENYISGLIRAIGPRLKSITHVTRLPIHDIERVLYKFELYPHKSNADISDDDGKFYGDFWNANLSGSDKAQLFRRTIGTGDQRLIAVGEPGYADTFASTNFTIWSNGDNALFGKRCLEPYKQMREFLLLTGFDHARIQKPVAVSPTNGLVFKYCDWVTLDNVGLNNVQNAEVFRSEVREFFDWATQATFTPGMLDIDHTERGVDRRFIDMVDMHESNFLIHLEDNCIHDWIFIDTEYFSNKNFQRNMGYRAHILDGPNMDKGFWGRLMRAVSFRKSK